ncbi:MAG TPA: ammonium transporter, partial [Armatimonadota bacterium]|nr:ammonium transporter [Armatimonadota bacterium]
GGNLRIGIVAVCTMLASASGAMVAMLYWWARYKKPDPSMCVNGMLAGLVAITAPSGWVDTTGALMIGAVAGVLVCIAVPAVERSGVDDPVGAFSVHGVCGAWGVLSVGLFADGTFGAGLNGVSTPVRGLLYGGGFGQLTAQIICIAACAVWAFATAFAFFKVQDKVMGIRSAREDELAGLDVPEMGVEAYPEDQIAHGLSGGHAPIGVPVGARPVTEA